MKKKIVKNFETINEIKDNPLKYKNYYKKVLSISEKEPYNFRDKLRYFRECLGYTREKLEELSYISLQTIKEIETNDSRGYSVETIISLCIGMKLPPEFSFNLLKSGGFSVENNSIKKNCIYGYILRNLYNYEIDEINDFLKSNGVNPLSKIK